MIKFVTDALKNRDEEKGFSLVELIVVVAILGILVVVAIPVYGAIQETARHNALETAAANGATSIASALAQGTVVDEAWVTANLDSDLDYSLTAPTGLTGAPVTTGANTSTDDVYVFVSNDNNPVETAGAGTLDGKFNSWS